ncbi:hypothetical protein QE152_g25751 [Popillia japonica]|uniref:Uncharacterized protein n=1 Tax=Popillia japonica TaxID=7064 RepID=A0AAW1K0K1_POPJA
MYGAGRSSMFHNSGSISYLVPICGKKGQFLHNAASCCSTILDRYRIWYLFVGRKVNSYTTQLVADRKTVKLKGGEGWYQILEQNLIKRRRGLVPDFGTKSTATLQLAA